MFIKLNIIFKCVNKTDNINMATTFRTIIKDEKIDNKYCGNYISAIVLPFEMAVCNKS